MMKFRIFFVFVFVVSAVFAQPVIRTTTTAIGYSPTNVKPITANSYLLPSQKTDCKLSSDKENFIIGGNNSGSIAGFLAAIKCESDSVAWIKQTSVDRIELCGSKFLACNETDANSYSTADGKDLKSLSGRVMFSSDKIVLIYDKGNSDVLSAVSLIDNSIRWTAKIPSAEHWSDTKKLNDSMLIIAANGLHAVNLSSGLIWAIALQTTENVKPNANFLAASVNQSRLRSISQAAKNGSAANRLLLASNIIVRNNIIYYAAKEKLVAVDISGKTKWEVDISTFPVSTMQVFATDSSLILLNTGAAILGEKFVSYGNPFALSVRYTDGSIMLKSNGNLDGMVDYQMRGSSLLIAGSEVITEFNSVKGVKEIAFVDPSYGNLLELIDGNEYFIMREGYFKPLNLLGGQLHYRSNNEKVYAVEKSAIKYEYNYADLYKFDKKHGERLLLSNNERTIIIDKDFELQYVLKTRGKSVIGKTNLYLVEDNLVHSVNLSDLR